MNNSNQQIQDLFRRIEQLNAQNTAIKNTIRLLNDEVNELAFRVNNSENNADVVNVEKSVYLPILSEVKRIDTPQKGQWKTNVEQDSVLSEAERVEKGTPQYKSDFEVSKSLEAFIGENLASKVGIIITVLGVSIGVKYAIDNDLISHWGRIILGYLAGCGLLETSFRLRRKDEKYENLSNIILSGGFASVFFVTYAAYSFYGLMPQTVAFALMVLIAGLTVAAALKYDQELIAVGGLVGAYAIPFLLSTGEDKPITLFSYMAIINAGILFISFKKDWRLLFYLSFVVTWLVFIGWINNSNNYEKTATAGTFLTLFFGIFYAIFLAYKFIKNEASLVEQTLVFLLNSAFFYGFGYLILDNNAFGKHYLGVFTLFNALLHLVVSKYVFERNLADKNLFNLLSAFVVFFVTMAIGVQFDGITVTLFWAAEMCFFFWLGRRKNLPIYANCTYPLWVLTLLSLVEDWSTENYLTAAYWSDAIVIPSIFNIYFLSTVLVIGAFLFTRYIHLKTDLGAELEGNKANNALISVLLTSVILGLTYLLFFNEINHYFNQQNVFNYLKLKDIVDENIERFRTVWIINYSLLFVGILHFVNLKKYKNIDFAKVISILSLFIISFFLINGLYALGALKNAYLYREQAEFFYRGVVGGLLLRYLSFALVAAVFYILNQTKNTFFNADKSVQKGFDLVVCATLLWILSSEMVHWLELNSYTQAYKWAISVFFGLFSFTLIGYSINEKKDTKHLRMTAIGLFILTLIKVFVFDLIGLDTIAKTIVLVSLGVLLLLISYLYTKFKDTLLRDE